MANLADEVNKAPARVRFAEEVKRNGGDAKVAKALKCCRSFVCMVRNGERIPGRNLLAVIERKYQIAATDWPIPKRKPRRARKTATV